MCSGSTVLGFSKYEPLSQFKDLVEKIKNKILRTNEDFSTCKIYGLRGETVFIKTL